MEAMEAKFFKHSFYQALSVLFILAIKPTPFIRQAFGLVIRCFLGYLHPTMEWLDSSSNSASSFSSLLMCALGNMSDGSGSWALGPALWCNG